MQPGSLWRVHTVVMRPVRHMAVTMVAVGLVGAVADCAGHHAVTPPTPQSICRSHFTSVINSGSDTVQGVSHVGPRPSAGWPATLGTYAAATPVALCLVGKKTDTSDNAIAITPDGKTYTVWTQVGSTSLVKP
jgi:hypothetical protein